MPRKTRLQTKAPKEPKPYVIALRLSERTYEDLLCVAHRRGVRRGTLAAELLEQALRSGAEAVE